MDIKGIAKELHKPKRKPKEYRKVYEPYATHTLGMDLVDMGMFSKQNKGYKYILIALDIYSRYAYAILMQAKTAELTWMASEPIIDQFKPKFIWVDRGTEFYNKLWESNLKKRDIIRYSTNSAQGVSTVERFNRTLKEMMWELFTSQGNNKWVPILQDLINEYNHRVHSSIKMTPLQALTNIVPQPPTNIEFGKPKYKVGDIVRISVEKPVFEKGHTPNWSYELFKITNVSNVKPIMYNLADEKGEPISGRFYESEVMKTKYPNDFLIEQVIKKGSKWALVKFMGMKEPQKIPVKDLM